MWDKHTVKTKGGQDRIGLEKERTNIKELHLNLSGSQQGAISHAFESPQQSTLR